MGEDKTDDLQTLLDCALDGDAARKKLLEQAYPRLEKLARKMFREDFRALGGQHDTGSVLHESWIRLMQAWPSVHLATVGDFFQFTAHKIRHVLLDMARKYRKDQERVIHLESVASDEPTGPENLSGDQNDNDPARLALWTEFHEQMDGLPEDEKEIADLHWYMDLKFAEISRIIGINEGVVKYRWKRTKARLERWWKPDCES